MTLSTHVLDATTGRPAVGLQIRLERAGDDGWVTAGGGGDNPHGRPAPPPGAGLPGGICRMTFGTGAYFSGRGAATFSPEVSITFEMTAPDEHYHVPLRLSPF